MAKTFMKDGKWIDNPAVPQVLKCMCGGKYIKTRVEQVRCLRCIQKKIHG